jgi:hypothetical protein
MGVCLPVESESVSAPHGPAPRRFSVARNVEGGGPIYLPTSWQRARHQRGAASPKPRVPIEPGFLTSLTKIQARSCFEGPRHLQVCTSKWSVRAGSNVRRLVRGGFRLREKPHGRLFSHRGLSRLPQTIRVITSWRGSRPVEPVPTTAGTDKRGASHKSSPNDTHAYHWTRIVRRRVVRRPVASVGVIVVRIGIWIPVITSPVGLWDKGEAKSEAGPAVAIATTVS